MYILDDHHVFTHREQKWEEAVKHWSFHDKINYSGTYIREFSGPGTEDSFNFNDKSTRWNWLNKLTFAVDWDFFGFFVFNGK